MARARIGTTALIVLTAALVAVGGVLLVGDGARADQDDGRGRTRVVTVEVAENGHEFVFDESPVFGEEAGDLAGFPAYGNAFVTGGYLYPEGTLGDSDGVNPDGSPEFPDRVIGRWFCRGHFVADGAATAEVAVSHPSQRVPRARPLMPSLSQRPMGARVSTRKASRLIKIEAPAQAPGRISFFLSSKYNAASLGATVVVYSGAHSSGISMLSGQEKSGSPVGSS